MNANTEFHHLSDPPRNPWNFKHRLMAIMVEGSGSQSGWYHPPSGIFLWGCNSNLLILRGEAKPTNVAAAENEKRTDFIAKWTHKSSGGKSSQVPENQTDCVYRCWQRSWKSGRWDSTCGLKSTWKKFGNHSSKASSVIPILTNTHPSECHPTWPGSRKCWDRR